MAFQFTRYDIPDVVHIETDIYKDNRGFFSELYKASDFKTFGLDINIVQVDYSKSQRGVIRGLHYQRNPSAQGKLVNVISGEMFDVAVDIRKGSPTFGKWVGVHLSAEKKNMLYIPEGFAHGFCVLSDSVEVLYHCTGIYCPKDARGIAWNDPAINIDWPVKSPVLSEKDKSYPSLSAIEGDLNYE